MAVKPIIPMRLCSRYLGFGLIMRIPVRNEKMKSKKPKIPRYNEML